MTAAAVLRMVAAQGAGQVAASAPGATAEAVTWIGAALVIIGAAYLVAYLRLPRRRMPLLTLPPAVPCPCCTCMPLDSDDCTCREDCGVTQCQAADPEPMFYEHGHVIDRAGREAILRAAREADRLEAEADAMAEEYRRQEGERG